MKNSSLGKFNGIKSLDRLNTASSGLVSDLACIQSRNVVVTSPFLLQTLVASSPDVYSVSNILFSSVLSMSIIPLNNQVTSNRSWVLYRESNTGPSTTNRIQELVVLLIESRLLLYH
ncbi:hypothetical protein Avbf_15088 [Armadillidium vulgare]|nr:hypothetical protein Avbf_15088 [Armadillidium vulgare]